MVYEAMTVAYIGLLGFTVIGIDIPESEATSFNSVDTSSTMLLIISIDTTSSPASASFNLSSTYEQ